MSAVKAAQSRMAAKANALAVLVGFLLWLSVIVEHPAQTTLAVPVRPEHLAAGLTVAATPHSVDVTVSGPRILLWLLPARGVSCAIDLAGAARGSASYPAAQYIQLPDSELKVVRTAPASVSVEVGSLR